MPLRSYLRARFAWAVVLFVSAAVLMRPCSTDAFSVHGPARIVPPRTVALHAADVLLVFGRGYRLLLQRDVPNGVVTSPSIVLGLAPVSQLRRGRITGFFDEFVRSSGASFKKGKLIVKPGVASVLCAVNAYRDQSGPRRLIQAALAYRLRRVTGLTYHVSRLAGVGDQAALHASRSMAIRGAPVSYSDTIFFRRNTYAVTVSVNSYGPLSLQSVVRLARIVDDRIRVGR